MPKAVTGKVPAERPGPKGGKRARNREERTQALAGAALALFLEHGIETVTIDDIARSAGTAKGNFYRYFDDKASLVEALLTPMAEGFRVAFQETHDALEHATQSDQSTAIYAMLATKIFQIALDHRDVVQLFLQEHRAPSVGARAPMAALSAELSRGAISLSELAVEHDLLEVAHPEVAALAVVGAVEHLALRFLRGELETEPAEAAPVVIGMVLDGLRRG